MPLSPTASSLIHIAILNLCFTASKPKTVHIPTLPNCPTAALPHCLIEPLVNCIKPNSSALPDCHPDFGLSAHCLTIKHSTGVFAKPGEFAECNCQRIEIKFGFISSCKTSDNFAKRPSFSKNFFYVFLQK